MFYQKDYIIRQIEMMAGALARLILGKDMPEIPVLEETHTGDVDPLRARLLAMVARLEINQAEQILFDELDQYNGMPCREILSAALVFYSRVNELADGPLQAANYSRDEIREGLAEVSRRYGLDVLS